jgi:glycosyltransferase involved in cell wall biosynthesis
VLERTAAEENVFQIPTPFSPGVLEELERTRLPRAGQSDAVSFFAPDLAASDPELDVVFQAFARVRAEGVQANLFLLALEKDAAPLLERAAALGIADAVHALPVSDAVHAYEFSDAVISQPPGATAADAEQDENSSAIQALLAGCALLAADGGRNRDLLDAGRGLVWYAPGDFRDLARRIALLTANPELRHSLAQSARRDLAAFRSPEAIGRMYQRVYHHAWQRRRIGGPGALPGATLEPLPQAS